MAEGIFELLVRLSGAAPAADALLGKPVNLTPGSPKVAQCQF